MQGETIICVSPRDWFALWKDTQSIMWRIARDNRVLYFDPGRDPESSVPGEFIRNIPSLFRLSSKNIHENLTVIPTPPSLPHARRHLPRALLKRTVPVAFRFNARMISLQIHRALDAYNIQNPILWLYSLYSTDLIGQFGEKLTCYTVYDDFAGFAQNWRIKDLLQRFDQELSAKVDVIFSTSQIQTEIHRAINPNTYFVPNAVDYDLFSQALDPSLPVPDDIATIPHPIIGFAGWMANQLDVALLQKISQAYPRCSLVFVGPNNVQPASDKKTLKSLPNAYFLGRKPRSDLPKYLQVFDVALIPYRLTAGHVRSVYPTKLHEYLAAGRSVVTTAMPEVEPFNHVVRIGRNHEEFISLINEALDRPSQAELEARLAVAKENTWDHRAEELNRILDHHLKQLKT